MGSRSRLKRLRCFLDTRVADARQLKPSPRLAHVVVDNTLDEGRAEVTVIIGECRVVVHDPMPVFAEPAFGNNMRRRFVELDHSPTRSSL